MSARQDFPQSAGREPGTWRLWSIGSQVRAIVVCPGCGVEGTLDHEVRTNGDVEPSVECPHEGCSFHAFIRLQDWPGLHLRLAS